MKEKNNFFTKHCKGSYSIYRFNKNTQYICEYKVDNKINRTKYTLNKAMGKKLRKTGEDVLAVPIYKKG